jgi:predicted alpha-1,6-mannanase (GH76 family)
MRALLIPLAVVVLHLPSHAQPPDYLQDAAHAIGALQGWYNQSTGLWNTTGWWNSANATTVLINYSRLAASADWRAAVENTYTVNSPKGFLNNYYDDEGWWALAWIDAYDWTGDTRYLGMAESIFTDMTVGWDSTCNGGIWWSKARTYKNAIANELFLSVAARLAMRAPLERQALYFGWATREWQWFAASGMIDARSLINDGLNSACQNNGGTTWTYNQGVILGGLAELWRRTQDPALRQAAEAIAAAAVERLSDTNGILHDGCEPNCGGDGVQFKGIFVRNLAELAMLFPSERLARFLIANAASIWSHAQGPGYQLGQVWSGPFNGSNAGIQAAALDCLVAAAQMRASRPIARHPERR